MNLAIAILTSELESYRKCAREELKYSVYPEYHGPNEDFGRNICELEEAISHLKNIEPKPQHTTHALQNAKDRERFPTIDKALRNA